MGWRRIVGWESDGSPIYGGLRRGQYAGQVVRVGGRVVKGTLGVVGRFANNKEKCRRKRRKRSLHW